jgi:acetoacetyl-CoA synthetase
VERFKQTEPKLVVSVNGVFYNGKVHSMSSKLEQIVSELPTLKKVVIIPFIQDAKKESLNFEWYVV